MNADHSDPPAAEVQWAVLADLHISADLSQHYRGFRPAAHAAAAVTDILEASPQAALVAGDLAWDDGLPGDYAQLRLALEPLARRIPVCLALGNHDNRDAFLAELFPSHAQGRAAVEKLLIVVEHGPIRWILLDSLFRTDIVGGLLGKAQRLWLRRVLETSDRRPTLIVVHHPLDEKDESLLDSDRLLRLVQPFPQVKAIVTAHDHAFCIGSSDGIHIVNLPAIGMPFDDAQPLGWLEASLSATQGVFTFHALGENRTGDGAAQTLRWR